MNIRRTLIAEGFLALSVFLVAGAEPEQPGADAKTFPDMIPDSLTMDMPAHWAYSSQYKMDMPSEDKWWHIFKDPLLDSLINEGENKNFNLKEAARRIEIARQSVRQAKSSLYPEVSTSLGWNAARTSGMLQKGVGASNTNYFSFGVDMSWEIDVFGKVRESVKSEKALVSASKAEYASVCVSLCAEIATYYMELRTLQEELKVTREHIKSQERVLEITETRFEVGLASMLDVSQAKTDYYSTVATITSIETQIATTINAIAVLIGEYPGNLIPVLEAPAAQPDAEYPVFAGVPMELLRRRPDIVEAEYTLASYAALLGVAEKDFLPTLSLTGSVGTSAHNIDKMFHGQSYTYSVAPTLSWTIFDGFARNAAKASAKEQMLLGIDSYNQTVLTAVQEVENAMVSYRQAIIYERDIAEVLKYARMSFELALDRYKQGLDAFINVADAQMTVLTYANELVAARGSALSSLISLYKALGGGWDVSDIDKTKD